MPWLGVSLTPGVNAELTATTVQAGYVSTILGRFKAGMFQKLGGWAKFTPTAISGTPFAMHAWQAINTNKYLSIGTSSVLGVLSGNSLQTLTPQVFTSNTAPNFTTTANSTTVTIVDANVNTITTYCSVFFNTPISVDGIILSGLYPVAANLSATSYTIVAGTAGLAGVSNGGAVPSFTTTAGSFNVTVTLNNHGLVANNDIVFPIATSVGGISISGRYVVVSITDVNNFVIAATNAAVTSAGPVSMNSGNAQLAYNIATGPTQPGGAYGAGNYGAGLYSIGSSVTGQTGTPITASDWTLGNFGEDLIACPQGGAIYFWGPSSGFTTMQAIAAGPAYSNGAFISTAQQMIIAYGSTVQSTIGVYQNPLLVKWCDVQNFNQWTPLPTTQAGSYPIPTGSTIVAGASTPFNNLIWTDIELWSMNYIGSQFIFSFVKTGSNCGIISKHAHTQLAGNVFWLGLNNIFVLSGGTVSILPCTVWDVIFQDLNPAFKSTCFAASNTLFSEVAFFYPSIADGLPYPTRYVKFNVSENTWDHGPLQRNCWVDQTVFGPPMAVTNTGVIYQHETGNDADVLPMTSGFTTGYFYLDEGRQFVFVDEIIPDFKFGLFGQSQGATITLTVNAVKYPGDTPVTYGPFTITQGVQTVFPRFRARQISLTIQSMDSGSFWRLGLVRFRFTPDGRHG